MKNRYQRALEEYFGDETIVLPEKEDKKEDHFSDVFLWLVIGPFLVAAVLFFSIGSVSLCSLRINEKRCTESVTGKVQVKTEYNYDDSENSYHFPKKETAVFRYWYKGVSYDCNGNVSATDIGFTDGEKVTIFVDPEKPQRVYIPAFNQKEKKAEVFTLAGGAMLIGIAIVFLKILYDNKKQPNITQDV